MTTPVPIAEAGLPDPATLSGAQQRGVHCVWCSVALANGTAHDLGPRHVDAHGTSALWFPRCCPSCRKGQEQ
ncbi:hypothetical protein ABZ622_00740 [Streptomyces sp. NPDC007164]|uniref:hypothetical protein n=1 Tax=Streptomyces sp. NPDC007164 TaxID=3156918 RepID=UPI0033C4BBC5